MKRVPFNTALFARLESGKGDSKTKENEYLNPYLQQTFTGENILRASMVQEMIQARGVVLHYIPREYVKIDEVFGEDPSSYFTKSLPFSAYIKNYEDFEGAGSFFSKFGYESTDEMEIEFSPTLFEHQTDGLNPIAGSLIYAPLVNALFEITFVKPENPYGQLGNDSILRNFTCVKWSPSHEEVDVNMSIPDHMNFHEFGFGEDVNTINNINNRATNRTDEMYKETIEAQQEAAKFMDEFFVLNGEGPEPIGGEHVQPGEEPVRFNKIAEQEEEVIDPYLLFDKEEF